MSARSSLIHLVTRASIALGALFLVGVLLAAIPNHHVPASQGVSANAAQQSQSSDTSSMPGMNMDPDEAKVGEHAAMNEMSHMQHAHNPHLRMTTTRPSTSADRQRAGDIVEQLRAGIEKYKDYHLALNDGFQIFHPEINQPEYHFTNYANGFLEAFTFDPSRPTSLLYKKTSSGYELIGAMYTMPKRATEEQLDERVPLSVATWHLHTNLCMPPRENRRHADYTKFGLRGSITTQGACDAAGGRFFPVIFGWMVHVYPFEDTSAKIFAMHHPN